LPDYKSNYLTITTTTAPAASVDNDSLVDYVCVDMLKLNKEHCTLPSYLDVMLIKVTFIFSSSSSFLMPGLSYIELSTDLKVIYSLSSKINIYIDTDISLFYCKLYLLEIITIIHYFQIIFSCFLSPCILMFQEK
jgi:hypothetical protein